MKKIIYLLGCFVGLVSLASCEKEMDSYSGRDGLYFDVQYTNTSWYTNPERWAHQIYSLVRFSFMDDPNATESQLTLKVNVLGEPRDYDRPFEVRVVADSTTAIPDVEYKDLSEHGVIKAGERYGYVTVTALRSERMENENVQLQLSLVPNEHFDLPITSLKTIPGRYTEELNTYSNNDDPRIHNIFITDIITQPKYFSEFYFGVFSREKMLLMLEVYPEVTLKDYEDKSTMPTVMQNMIAERMAGYLIEQFRAGNPITDPDGTMMYVKGVPWEEEAMPDDVVLN